MGKLGKKARKFAKKHLQSVLRQRRKTKALFKKKSPKEGQNDAQEHVDNPLENSTKRNGEYEGIANISLDTIFTENGKDEVADALDSDGYLSEDSSCSYVVERETDKTFEDQIATSTYSDRNKKIQTELAIQTKKLNRLRKKDPEFSKFIDSSNNISQMLQSENGQYSDEDDSSDKDEQGDDDLARDKKLLTSSAINVWCEMVRVDHSHSAFISLLNAYRAACHYGAESIGRQIENSETFCGIVLFMLSNADDIFRGQLQMPSSNSLKESLLELKRSSKWNVVKPLIKSFVRSTLFLLNQVIDTNILAFAMTKIRASLIFFSPFPSVTRRLTKATVHLWATGGQTLSPASYLVIRDIVSMLGPDYFDACLSSTMMAFISRSRVAEIADIKHMQFLKDCLVELCSLDVQKSSLKAVASMSQLAKILSWAVQAKKEAVKMVCSWEYVNCIDLWVMFISVNLDDHNLQSLLFMTIQLINGLAHMFPGPRYFPLRLKCIQWLNNLSSSSGNFIPLAPLVLDLLEYKVVKEGSKNQDALNTASVLKLPKHYLKSRSFHEECFHSAIEQLSVHFGQWSYHISFPDLATVPLIRLRKINEITTTESLRRMVQRFIDQVEQNVAFVQRKREEASFSPLDHQSVDSFLQLEKSSSNASFTKYYRSVNDKAAERNLQKSVKMSLPKRRNLKRNRAEQKVKKAGGSE